MKSSSLLPVVAVAALTFSISARGYAYCQTRTCDPNTGQCEFDQAGCNISGKPLFWPNSCVSFDVQWDGSPKLNIDYDTVHSVVVKAFAQWTNADCGNGAHPSIQVTDFGPVTCAKPEYNKTQPNANVITFHDSPWPYTNAIDTLALTTVYFLPDTGEMYDANIEINSAEDSFANGNPTGDQFDLNAVLTHEAGHFLGLSHSGVQTATMFSSYMPGMGTIESDDVTAICLSLPPDRTPDSSDCTPRHGFSGDCGKPETGCCATAVGANASPRQTLGLFTFGLGLCVWLGRLRFRRSPPALQR